MTEKREMILDDIADILLRSFIYGIVLLCIWFVVIAGAGDFVYKVHTSFIGLSRHAFNMLHYGGMMLVKMGLLIFFLIPYIAIKRQK